ncbi:MAG TPA: 5'/3'-nucleotidase SurE [Blastocatellia bacterium]|nr:5'/3'-nucleotidase SurE [Blastocatellia bacterium]
MTRILVTNDDGVFTEGIAALARALETVGEVTVVAPASEQSASAHSLTLTRPLRIRQIEERRYSVDGTPTDCVTLALTVVMANNPPHLVVSGINYGANLGDDVTYSGTVAGALEASVFGLPGIAVSLVTRSDFKFDDAAKFAADLAQKVLERGLPEGTILNVNVPPGPVRGARWTHQGIKSSRTRIVEGVDPRGRPYYWIGEQEISWRADANSDYAAIEQGLVSITPLRTDMTDYRSLEQLRNWTDLNPQIENSSE